ncbi:MAG: hypothetical protein WAM71_15675 [Candidatus Korobacteraceae bacterium]
MRKYVRSGNTFIASVAICALGLLLPVVAAGQVETIDATARGTSTQMGSIRSVKIVITQFSTPEDKQVLVDAFKKGQSQGLYDALSKMKSAGQIQIPGTVGYALAYVSSETTPTGRTIRFITNRKIAFGEALRNTQSQAYDLTAGKIDINDKDSKKSAGTLFPATQLIVNKEGQLQWELRKNPWELTNIIDWNKGKER